MSRDIPTLFSLCLRYVGSHDCSTEKTFAPRKQKQKQLQNDDGGENKSTTNKKELSTASMLLKSFHNRPEILPTIIKNKNNNIQDNIHNNSYESINDIPIKRLICCGSKGSSRRANANDVDINHPFVGSCSYYYNNDGKDGGDSSSSVLLQQYGNTALDCLQSYVDALVEQGRMDDTRLGKYFFDEWCRCVTLGTYDGWLQDDDDDNDGDDDDNKNERGNNNNNSITATGTTTTIKTIRINLSTTTSSKNNKNKKRKRSITPPAAPAVSALEKNQKYKGSLSLCNCSIGDETLKIMIKHKNIGKYLNVLDMTGCLFLTDIHTINLLSKCLNLQRLSLKNCRRLTSKITSYISSSSSTCRTTLKCLDIGGSINITPNDVLSALGDDDNDDQLRLPNLNELYASGLGWNDNTLLELVQKQNNNWIGLGIGFSNPIDDNNNNTAFINTTASTTGITNYGLRKALSYLNPNKLERLAIQFIENSIDNEILGYLGKNFYKLNVIDIRGNINVNTLTSFYDGRTTTISDNNNNSFSNDTSSSSNDSLFILARYSSITQSSIDETKRIYPLRTMKLTCIIDGNGTGGGITRR